MRTLRSRVEKLEREGNTSDGPFLQLFVMPAGFQLSEDLAKADESLPPRKTCTGVLAGRFGAWRRKALLVSRFDRLPTLAHRLGPFGATRPLNMEGEDEGIVATAGAPGEVR
jgi:hypothetical protein